MLRSMNSSSYPRDDHLRHLLDQRSARADINGRFSSVSEYSDTPSVYSHRFSPIPQDKGYGDNVKDINFGISHPQPVNSEPRSPMSDREMLNDPSASSLDLDDDYRSSYASSNTYDEDNENTLNAADVEEDPRMSMLGPKMRIHGRAPWEMGEDTLEEGDESDSSGKSRAFSTKRAQGKGEGFIKSFGRSSSNPLASRRSNESNRPRERSKGSFETTASTVSNSQGALQALAQASISSSSLNSSSNEPLGHGSGLRNKFSMPRIRPMLSNYNDSRAKSPLSPSPRSTVYSDSPTTSEFSRASSTSSPRASTSTAVNQDFIHPYANPDLVVSYAADLAPISPKSGAIGNISRSDSISTITDAYSMSSHSTLRHMVSGASLQPINQQTPRASSITGKGISLPISMLRPSDLSPKTDHRVKEPQVMARPTPLGPNGIPGWMDNPGSPTIQLISLAEAQAQARERSRSATVNDGQSIPFPERNEKNSSPTSSMRSRTRSVSAGAKARSALSNMVGGTPPAMPDRRDSEPSISASGVAGKSLKHKKSGFMRIFNGKEREAIPPVPALADEYAAHNHLQPLSVPKVPKISLPRIPVPPLGPSKMDESSSVSSSLSNVSDSGFSAPGSKMNAGTKRTPPSLQIQTSSHSPRTLATGNQTLPTPATSVKPEQDEGPRSAPPSTTDFPSLSLRPVSAIFSAHFADHIVAPEVGSPVEGERNVDTPSSISPGRSPLTPGFSLRSDGSTADRPSVAAMGFEDQASVIQALQEQIVSARKAWQQHIWELEGQVRDLKAEVDGLRIAGNDKGYCEACGRGKSEEDGHNDMKKVGVVNRPRARTGDAARFGNGN